MDNFMNTITLPDTLTTNVRESLVKKHAYLLYTHGVPKYAKITTGFRKKLYRVQDPLNDHEKVKMAFYAAEVAHNAQELNKMPELVSFLMYGCLLVGEYGLAREVVVKYTEPLLGGTINTLCRVYMSILWAQEDTRIANNKLSEFTSEMSDYITNRFKTNAERLYSMQEHTTRNILKHVKLHVMLDTVGWVGIATIAVIMLLKL